MPKSAQADGIGVDEASQKTNTWLTPLPGQAWKIDVAEVLTGLCGIDTHSDSSATQKTEEAAPKAEEAAPKAEEAAPKAEEKEKRRTGKAVQPHSPASQEGRKLVREAVL